VTQFSSQSIPIITIFDMNISLNSPAGSCVVAEINGLADSFQIIAVSAEFNNCPKEIKWLRVPVPSGPVLLRYLVFHALAPLVYAVWRLRGGHSDIIQATQGQFPPADIAYAHFCHRAYLKNQWLDSTVNGPRRLARWLSHQFNAFFEEKAFARCRLIVVPSLGLAKELAKEYPNVENKIEVVPNPVSLERFIRPANFNRQAQRQKLGILDNELVISFMALGDFARKGLGLLIEALGKLDKRQRVNLKLLVIGGKSSEIDIFRSYALQQGVANNLIFTGMQLEIAPYLWVSDVFALPSSYETFALAVFQAAASGLPVLVTHGIYGVEEIIVNGVNGWQVDRDSASISQWMHDLLNDRENLYRMSDAAVESVKPYSNEAFIASWQAIYRKAL